MVQLSFSSHKLKIKEIVMMKLVIKELLKKGSLDFLNNNSDSEHQGN
jgi:hypothetical protein